MARVSVSRDVLRWAQERSGVSRVKLAERFPAMGDWETGETQPTLRQLEAYARKTLTPIGFFFLPTPPDDQLPIPNYRTLSESQVGRPSPNLLETVLTMIERQAWMREYMIDLGQPPLPFIGVAAADRDVAAIAASIHQELGVEHGWTSAYGTWTDALAGLVETGERARILVVINGVVGNDTHRKLDPDEFRGFVLTDDYAPLVFINGADYKSAQMFTLAHELAHLWLGKSAAFDLRGMQPAPEASEQLCDRVAAEFLVPANELRTFWPSARHSPHPFEEVARYFKVSAIVGARRALDLSLIDRAEFFEFYSHHRESERKTAAKSSGGDFYANQDHRLGRPFARAVLGAVREGRLLYHDAYRLTGLRGETFDKYARRLEGTQR